LNQWITKLKLFLDVNLIQASQKILFLKMVKYHHHCHCYVIKDLLEEHIFFRKKAFLNRDMNANEKYVKFLFENTPQPLHDNLSQIEFDFIRDVIKNM